MIKVEDIDGNLNRKHLPFFQAKDREIVLYGGSDAGKSYSIADKLLLQSILWNGIRMKALLIRKTLNSLKKTTFDILTRRAETHGLDIKINRSDWTARVNMMEFLTTGVNNQDDYKKLKSMTDIDFIWLNEAPEVREDDYKELLLRLRGERRTNGMFRQVISDFNPIGKTSWVFKRFFEQNNGNVRKFRYTCLDNPWAEKEFIAQLKATKRSDPNFYKIYFLGEWGELEGVIFDWDIVPLPDIKFNEIFYGGDFGYSVDPASFVRIYRKADEFWIEELIYETGLTNIELAEKILSKETGYRKTDPSYWDSAEPKSIQELYDKGINAQASIKGADSVRAGIDYLRKLKIHIVEGSENLIKEVKSYIWKKDKDGNSLNAPIEFNNHAVDATRYGIYTHCKNPAPFFAFGV